MTLKRSSDFGVHEATVDMSVLDVSMTMSVH